MQTKFLPEVIVVDRDILTQLEPLIQAKIEEARAELPRLLEIAKLLSYSQKKVSKRGLVDWLKGHPNVALWARAQRIAMSAGEHALIEYATKIYEEEHTMFEVKYGPQARWLTELQTPEQVRSIAIGEVLRALLRQAPGSR